MSTYLIRHYEVKVSIIHQSVKDMESANIPSDPEDGYTIYTWNTKDEEGRYNIYSKKKGEWVKKKKPNKAWVLVRSFSKPQFTSSPNSKTFEVGKVYERERSPYADENEPLIPVIAKTGEVFSEEDDYTDNGGYIRDNYIASRGWSDDDSLQNRGFPDDMSPELSSILEVADKKYRYDETYVTLSEWVAIREKVFNKLKRDLEAIHNERSKEAIMDKLCDLEKLIKNEEVKKKRKRRDSDTYESPDTKERYLWEEDYVVLRSIDSEIDRAYFRAEAFTGGFYVDYEDVRIIYYLA